MTTTPPITEFIDLDARRKSARYKHGFGQMKSEATVAVYPTSTEKRYLILSVRLSEEAAQRLRLVEGQRFSCHIHPDQQHLALRMTSNKRQGAALFRPKGSRALVYQTTLKDGEVALHKARNAELSEKDGAIIVSISQSSHD